MPSTIVMPALSAGMEEGTIVRWTKAVGDSVAKGEIIAEVETDKAVMEFEADQDGVLGAILAAEGEAVPVNAAMAILLLSGEDASALGHPASAAVPTAAAEADMGTSQPAVEWRSAVPRRVAASPLARRIARDRGLSLEGLSGSGARGRIVRIDVENAGPVTGPSAPSVQPSVPQRPYPPHRRIPNSGMRKVIAGRLTEAKATIPHFYLNVECEVDALLDLRGKLNAAAGSAVRLSINDFVVKAAALALRSVPEVNSAWTEEATLLFDEVDISIAVATDGGLITPILRQADRKGLGALSEEVRLIAARAREGSLKPDDYQGGGFTISNLGMHGVQSFGAIINPPQSAILAVGAAQRRAVVRGDACVPAHVLQCTLSVDHRSVDGAVGARFLAVFKSLLEQPLQLML
ncbi:MAG: pyruvate dehydrogenase complex dihydrolipoamide acetyltransferase [Sphingomonadales bacterium]